MSHNWYWVEFLMMSGSNDQDQTRPLILSTKYAPLFTACSLYLNKYETRPISSSQVHFGLDGVPHTTTIVG